MDTSAPTRKPIVVPPEEGRAYEMGRMRALFKADNEESASRYSVSEWWLEPQTRGPGTHSHDDDHVFYVLTGILSVCLDEEWSQLKAGSYAVIPGGTPHNFENRGSERTGFIAFTTPGGFEKRMPGPDGIAAALAAEDLRL